MAEGGPAPGAMERRVRVRAGWISLAVGTAVFAGKLLAFVLTDSTAALSDAMESVVNVVAAALLVYSLIVAARPADRDHPYGHGKVEFFSAGVEGALIAVAGLLIVVQSVRDLLAGPSVQRLDAGLVLLTAMAAANGALGLYLVRLGRRTRSLALEADGRHLFTDVVTSVGVVLGLAAVWVTGQVWLDPVVALAVALHILGTGWTLMRRAVGGLMDEADTRSLEQIARGLEEGREPWCIDVHGLRAWRSGALLHVDLHVSVPRYFDVDRIHAVNHQLEARILDAAGTRGDVLVHFDPCRPRQCPDCAMPDCPVREAPLRERPPITPERATRGDESLDSGRPIGRIGGATS